MKCLFHPQYLVEPQYVEGYFKEKFDGLIHQKWKSSILQP
jgi:hypothetical protein